jgi:hypothetical protein
MFNLRDFVFNGLMSAIGKMNDYQIVLNAAGWFDKGVLSEEDLASIQDAIAAQYPTETEEVPVEG